MKPTSGKTDRVLAIVGAVFLLITHLDFWRGERTEIYFGFLPEEMAYRIFWMLLAWAYLLFFTTRVWRDERAEDDR